MNRSRCLFGLVMLFVVFTLVPSEKCYGNVPEIDEIWQLTSDDTNSGWGIFSLDDEEIVYFELVGRRESAIYSVNIESERKEYIALFSSLKSQAFTELFKPQWSKRNLFTVVYGDPSTAQLDSKVMLLTDMFGDATSYDVYTLCLRKNYQPTAYGVLFSPDRNDIAILCGTGEIRIIPFNIISESKPYTNTDLLIVPFDIEKTGWWDYSLDSWSALDELFVTEYVGGTSDSPAKRMTDNEANKIFKIQSNGDKKYIAKHACCADAHPDGDLILYIDTLDGEVWVMDNNGKNQTPLTNNGNNKFNPVWSNDGNYISWTELKPIGSGKQKFGQKAGGGEERYVIMFASLDYGSSSRSSSNKQDKSSTRNNWSGKRQSNGR